MKIVWSRGATRKSKEGEDTKRRLRHDRQEKEIKHKERIKRDREK